MNTKNDCKELRKPNRTKNAALGKHPTRKYRPASFRKAELRALALAWEYQANCGRNLTAESNFRKKPNTKSLSF